MVSLFLALPGSAQVPQEPTPADTSTAKPQEQQPNPDKGAWRVRVSKGVPQTFGVKATNARLADIANDMARRLKVKVLLSPLMQKRRVTVDFDGLTLDAALRMLAPKPYIDYEVGGEGSDQPKILAIYFYALNERPPDVSVALQNKSEAILIEGDTEEGTEGYDSKKKEEEQPLTVSFTQSQLSVKAHKQPLTVVLYKIASEVGIPFEMRYESREIVDVEFTNYPLEQAMRSLSSAVRYYFRTDLQTFEIQPLRIALVGPAAVKS